VKQTAEEDGEGDLLEQAGTLTEALEKLVERQPDREALVLFGREKRETRVAPSISTDTEGRRESLCEPFGIRRGRFRAHSSLAGCSPALRSS